MSRLTVRLPETLHQELARMAEQEGVSLNQYIVYALTRQTSLSTSRKIEQQAASFQAVTTQMGQASSSEVERCLAERAVVNCEPELTNQTIEKSRAKIRLDLAYKRVYIQSVRSPSKGGFISPTSSRSRGYGIYAFQ